jgi:DNA adenine methylase Dam
MILNQIKDKKINTRFFRYSGSKYKYVETINKIINKSDKKIYCEPFIGSGAVFFNLEKKFDKYFINDLNPHVYQVYNSFKNCEYTDFKNADNFIKKEFGNLKKSKESYYTYRSWYNTNHYNKDTIESGIYLYFLINSCINSLTRFGPSGFNQGFGECLYLMDETNFNAVKTALNNTEILNLDFFDVMNFIENDVSNSLLFLDPPYIQRSSTYKISNAFYDRYIDFCKNSKADIVYTDIYSQDLEWEYQVLNNNMINRSPANNKDYTGNKEVVFYNFDLKLKLF